MDIFKKTASDSISTDLIPDLFQNLLSTDVWHFLREVFSACE